MLNPVRQVKMFMKTNKAEVLAGVAIVGVVATAITTADATIKAVKIVEDRAIDQQNLNFGFESDLEVAKTPLDKRQIFDLVWRFYIPPAMLGVATIVCVLGSNRVSAAQTAAAATMYTISERAYSDYRERIAEKIGPGKDVETVDEVNANVFDEPSLDRDSIFDTHQGDVVCQDCVSGRYFYSSVDAIRRAENEINSRVLRDDIIVLSEFYDLIGLNETTVSDHLGWGLDNQLSIHYTPVMSEADRPCVYISYGVKPISVLSNYR